jgi:hypothetical protein
MGQIRTSIQRQVRRLNMQTEGQKPTQTIEVQVPRLLPPETAPHNAETQELLDAQVELR